MQHAIIKLTGGNIRNNHIYLANAMDLFPKSSIGGSSRQHLASQLLEIFPEACSPFFTDIAGDKKIFRERAPIRRFFEINGLVAGDHVVLERLGPHQIRIYPMPPRPSQQQNSICAEVKSQGNLLSRILFFLSWAWRKAKQSRT